MKSPKEFLKSKYIWEAASVADQRAPENYFNLEDLLKEYAAQCQADNAERNECIQDLLRFCDTDGTVMNGFRTKEIILKLKYSLNK